MRIFITGVGEVFDSPQLSPHRSWVPVRWIRHVYRSAIHLHWWMAHEGLSVTSDTARMSYYVRNPPFPSIGCAGSRLEFMVWKSIEWRLSHMIALRWYQSSVRRKKEFNHVSHVCRPWGKVHQRAIDSGRSNWYRDHWGKPEGLCFEDMSDLAVVTVSTQMTQVTHKVEFSWC